METHTLEDVITMLNKHNFKQHKSGQSVLAQCPKHTGGDLNCQISIGDNDRAYAYCYSHCQGYWLDEVFPEMRQEEYKDYGKMDVRLQAITPREKEYTTVNLFPMWQTLLPLPPSPRVFPELSNDELNALGWRRIANGEHGLGTGIFIPYWNERFKPRTLLPADTYLPFGQTRHQQGERRFSFAKDLKPTLYGKWSITEIMVEPKGQRPPLLLVEGTHDAVVLMSIGVPAIAVPSASSKELVEGLAKFCKEQEIPIIFSGDNDEAGMKIADELGENNVEYLMVQPPKPHKDWGEFAEAQGLDAVAIHVDYPSLAERYISRGKIDKVKEIMGGGIELTIA